MEIVDLVVWAQMLYASLSALRNSEVMNHSLKTNQILLPVFSLPLSSHLCLFAALSFVTSSSISLENADACWKWLMLAVRSFSILSIRLFSLLKYSWHGISRPPCGKSRDYLLFPLARHVIDPFCLRNKDATVDIILGKLPTTTPSFITETANGSYPLLISRSQVKTSPFFASQMFL